MLSSDNSFIFGGDVGGTGIKYGMSDRNGSFCTSQYEVLRLPSMVKDGPKATVEQLRIALSRALEKIGAQADRVARVGIAVAGPATLDGVMHFSGNFGESWREIAIRQMVEDEFGIPTSFENDANAAGLGEREFLVRERSDYANTPGMLLTVGTGLGGAFFGQSGELLRGATGGGGELGHLPMPYGKVRSSVNLFDTEMRCGCERNACVEMFTSRSFLEREVRARRSLDDVNSVYANPDENTWVDALLDEASKGNRFALDIIRDQGFNLGMAAGRTTFVLDPRYVILGGGISNSSQIIKDEFLLGFMSGFKDQANPYQLDKVEIRFASLGNNAGWYGATISARECYERGAAGE